jgi:TRAP-type C4-dicarboxylate transport system permease small subunit
MDTFSRICALLASVVLHFARLALASLGLIVIYGVFMRYALSDAPPYVEQVALILVICVAMFGAAAGAREEGHIGLDSVSKRMPAAMKKWMSTVVDGLTLIFSAVIFNGSIEMATSTQHDLIPTLGIAEAWRYLPVLIASALIFMFAIEHLLVVWAGLRRVGHDHLTSSEES